MTDLTQRLDDIQARADAATGGPWHGEHDELGCVHFGDYGWVASGPSGAGPEYDVDSEQGQADAEFIAHARTDIPALVAALRAVLDLIDDAEAAENGSPARTFEGHPFPATIYATRITDAIATALGLLP